MAGNTKKKISAGGGEAQERWLTGGPSILGVSLLTCAIARFLCILNYPSPPQTRRQVEEETNEQTGFGLPSARLALPLFGRLLRLLRLLSTRASSSFRPPRRLFARSKAQPTFSRLQKRQLHHCRRRRRPHRLHHCHHRRRLYSSHPRQQQQHHQQQQQQQQQRL